jgi:hypothetical protein
MKNAITASTISTAIWASLFGDEGGDALDLDDVDHGALGQHLVVEIRTGTDALVGRKAVVTRQVDAAGGRILVGGEEWSARSYLDGQVLVEGQTVDIVQIEGATALVVE